MKLLVTELEAQELIDKFVLVPLGDAKFNLELKPFPDGAKHSIDVEVIYVNDPPEGTVISDTK